MDLNEFDYELPVSSIAQVPAETRDASRLLVIDRCNRAYTDSVFTAVPEILRPGDCLVVNDSKVIPARVLAQDAASGRPVELLFLESVTPTRWKALVRPGRRCRDGAELIAGGERGARLRVVGIETDGVRLIERLDGPVIEMLDTQGLPPLPPYIAHHKKPGVDDRERYQTVYAAAPGSVAAPTAGLHFTRTMLDRLAARGVEIHALTLHVGPGTFRPIRVSQVEAHTLPAERVTIPPEVAQAVNVARASGRRVVAVGTTTTRALEGAVDADGRVNALTGAVDLVIRPGHRVRVVDALLTNFHLPRSSLLLLVAAFAGRELVLDAYRHAIRAGYRFYSYGDATLIV